MRIIFSFFSFLFLSCSNSIDYYKNNNPKLNILNFFNGKLESYGIFYDYQNRVTLRFQAHIDSKAEKNTLFYKAHMIFDDNTIRNREMKITFIDENKFKGKANDIDGELKGEQRGNVANLKYALFVGDKKKYSVNANAFVYLIDEKNAIEKIVMKKFGIKVGEMILYIKKI